MLRVAGKGGGGAERGNAGIAAAAACRDGGGGTGSPPRDGAGMEADWRVSVGGGGRRPGGGRPPGGSLDDVGIGDGGADIPRSVDVSTPRPDDGWGVRDVP